MTDEEKDIINKLEQIKVNVEGILYNFEAGEILCLITKLRQENEKLTTALSKQSKDIGNYLAELQQKDKQIDLMAENITLFKSAKENPKVPDWCSGAKIVSLSKEEIKEYFEKLAKEKK